MNFTTSRHLLSAVLAISMASASLPAQAQPDRQDGIHERSSFSITNDYSDLKISRFSVIYLGSDHMLYNLMNRRIYDSSIYDFSINPTGASMAVLYKNAKNIVIISNRDKNTILATVKGDKKTDPFDEKERKGTPSVTAMAYSTDARELLAANDFGEIITYSTDGYWISSVIEAGKIYDHIAVSPTATT